MVVAYQPSVFTREYRSVFYSLFGGFLTFAAFYSRELLAASTCPITLKLYGHLSQADAVFLAQCIMGAALIARNANLPNSDKGRGTRGLFCVGDWLAAIRGDKVDPTTHRITEGTIWPVWTTGGNWVAWLKQATHQLLKILMWLAQIAAHIYIIYAGLVRKKNGKHMFQAFDTPACKGASSTDLLSEHTAFWYAMGAFLCVFVYEALLGLEYVLRDGVRVVRAVSGSSMGPAMNAKRAIHGAFMNGRDDIDTICTILVTIVFVTSVWQSYDTLGPHYCNPALAQEYQLVMILSVMLFMHHSYRPAKPGQDHHAAMNQHKKSLDNSASQRNFAEKVEDYLAGAKSTIAKGGILSLFIMVILLTQLAVIFEMVDDPCLISIGGSPSKASRHVGKLNVYLILACFIMQCIMLLGGSNRKGRDDTGSTYSKVFTPSPQPAASANNHGNETRSYLSLGGRSSGRSTTTTLQFV